jgi:zinc protease
MLSLLRPRAGAFAALALAIAACAPAPKPVTMPPPVKVPVAPPGPDTTTPATSATAARAEKVRELEGITEYRLPNGLQILLFPDQTKSTVTVNMTYFVGSRVEGYGETGMAHLLEHMLFKGTEKYDSLFGAVERRGATVLNGSTWYDRTNFFETLPASDDNLTFALDVEAERMRRSKLDGEELAKEFSVVRNEFEMGENDPVAIVTERVESTAFLWHNYGKSTIGSRSDIEKVPIESLRAFYDKYYQPDNAVLIVSGKFEPAAALAQIEQIYGRIPRPERKLQPSYTVEPVQDGDREVTLRRNGEVHVLVAAYHTVAGSDPDFAAVEAAADILTRKPTGRLYGPLLKSKLASSLKVFPWRFHDPGLVEFTVEVRDEKNLAKVRNTLLDVVEGLASTKITEAEVERYKNNTLKDLELSLANSEQVAIELSEWASMGDWRLLFAYRDRVRALAVADVQRVAKTWFKPSNRTLGTFVPTKDADRAPLAETPDIQKIAESVKGTDVITGEAFVASIENITARTELTKLAAAIDAALLPKKTRGGIVQLRLTLRSGDLTSLKGRELLGGATAALVQRGTTKHTFQQLEDEKARLRASIGVYGSGGEMTLVIDTVRDSLPGAIDLAMEMLKTPSFPKDELEVLRQQVLARLEANSKDPEELGAATLARMLKPYKSGDPRLPWLPSERAARWKKIKVADIKAYHRDFWGAGKGELVVIGDFDSAAVKAQLEKALGDWKAKKAWSRLPEERFGTAGGEKKIDIKDKEMAHLAFAHDLDLREDDPDFAAAKLVGYIAGGGVESRLFMRLRVKEGYSYGAWGSIKASADDRVGFFEGGAIVAPANLAKARAAMLEELTKLRDQGVDQEELDRMRTAWLEEQGAHLSNDGTLGERMSDLLYEGRTLAWVADLHAKVKALTVEQVNAAAKKYIQPDRLIVVEAADYAKAKAATP